MPLCGLAPFIPKPKRGASLKGESDSSCRAYFSSFPAIIELYKTQISILYILFSFWEEVVLFVAVRFMYHTSHER